MQNITCQKSKLRVKNRKYWGVNMIQSIKCLLGFHKEQWLGVELPFYRKVLMK